MKFFVANLCITVTVLLLCLSAFAAETVVYVDADAAGGNGSIASPFATLKDAVASFDGTSGGEIVLLSTVYLADGAQIDCDCDGGITVTANGGGLSFGGKFYINAPIKFADVDMDFTADVPMLFCEGNNVTFGKGITTSYVKYAPIIYGGTYGGKSGMTYKKMCFSDYTVRIDSGTWYYVKGGSFRDGEGQPVGTLSDVTLEITGGKFTSNKKGAADNALISPLGFDALLGDAALHISGGSFSCSLVGVSRPGYNSTVSNNQYIQGNIYVNITGGSFSGGNIRAVQDSVASEINGDFYVNISGGNFSNFGGVDGACVNGLAIADVKSDIPLQNVDRLITLEGGGTATVTGDALVRIKGTVPSGALCISGNGKVVVEGATADAKITIDHVWHLGSDTEIRDVALDGNGTGIISCADGKILVGEGVTGNGVALKNFTDATLRSGLFAYIRGAAEKDVKLHIDGATVSSNVVAVSGNGKCKAYVLVTAGKIGGDIYAFEYSGSEGAVHVFADGFSGKVGCAKYPTEACVDTFGAVVPDGAVIAPAGCVRYNLPTAAIFVASGGSGDGASPLSPVGDLCAAVEAANGRTVVVCGPLHLKSTTVLPDTAAKTVITSKYVGVDYRDFTDARIVLSEGLRLGGETVFEHVEFLAFERYTFLSAEGHKLTVGEGVACSIFAGKRVEKYPSLVGASHAKTVSIDVADLTVMSGTWGTVTGGSYHPSDTDTKAYTVTGDVCVNIYGGTFHDGVYLAGRANVLGNAVLNIYGGSFECPVYAAHDNDTAVRGDVRIHVQGGTFCGDIGRYGVGKSFTLAVAGGNFDRVGIVDVGGGVLNVSEDIDIAASVSGAAEYQNPVADYADPSVVYHDGWYYYSFAKEYLGKPAIYMAKAANIYDVGNVRPQLIWAQAQDTEGTEVKSLWAPQLYFLEGKWYLYATCDVGIETALTNGRRMPVIWRGLTDDPQGEYEYIGVMKNVDMEVTSYNSPRIIRHGGKLYMINGSFFREEDCTNQHIQRMFVSELADPITAAGAAVVISSPMYAYEENIMEGPFPVYSPNGTLYVIFAAGHTRTDEYCTGILRFNGGENDSLQDASKWEKFSTPLHKASYENGVYSPGAMVVTVTPDGGGLLAVYHAKEYHYSAYTMRRLYVQEMTFENDFPTVGEPQPTDTVFTLALNAMPLEKRIRGYAALGVAEKKTSAPPCSATKYGRLSELGDMNADGRHTLLDVLRVLYLLHSGAGGEISVRADTDINGILDIRDALRLLRSIL